MARRELIDVGTGRHYVETANGARRLRSVVRRDLHRRSQSVARPRRASPANLARVGLLMLCGGAVGLFGVLYTHAEHLEALLVCITCLGAMILGACTIGLRTMEPPLRRP